MNYIQSTSILIRNKHDEILMLVNKNKLELDEGVKFLNEEYYKVGSKLEIGDRTYVVIELLFIYRERMLDFQAVVVVE